MVSFSSTAIFQGLPPPRYMYAWYAVVATMPFVWPARAGVKNGVCCLFCSSAALFSLLNTQFQFLYLAFFLGYNNQNLCLKLKGAAGWLLYGSSDKSEFMVRSTPLSTECKIPCINHFPNSKDLTFSLRAFSFSAAAADRRASTNVAKAGFWVPTAPLEVADEAEAVAAPPPLEVSTVAVVVVVVVTVVVPPVVVVVAAVSVVPFAVPVGALPSFFFSAETEW